MQLTRSILALLGCVALLPSAARAQTTIDPTLAYGWAANTGYTNWRPSAAQGARIGEYVCSGYVYSGNVGWINLGSGSPVNAVQYQNKSAADYGVNFFPTAVPGTAILRGLAYGANIGWINFEAQGNPSVNLLNGQLAGYAYSANTGWINLGTMTVNVVKTLAIAPGADSDGDGIADAWELIYFGNLTSVSSTSDSDGDGIPDSQEYNSGTDPLNANDLLRVTAVAKSLSKAPLLSLTFASTPARLYRIEASPTLVEPTWTDSGLGNFLPDSGAATVRQVARTGEARFFRVKALRLGF